MRTIGPAILFIVSVIPVSAQFVKGDKFVGGIINFNTQFTPRSNSGQGYNQRVFSISPQFGYFLNSKWAIGLLAGYSYSDSKTEYVSYTVTGNTHSYSAGTSITRYFQIADKFY